MSLTEVEPKEKFFSLPIMVGTARSDGSLKRLNPAWEATLGWTHDELLEKPFLSLLHTDDREATAAKLKDGGGTTINLLNRYLCRDGSYRWLEWSVALDEDKNTVFIARDVTDAMRIQHELAEKAVATINSP